MNKENDKTKQNRLTNNRIGLHFKTRFSLFLAEPEQKPFAVCVFDEDDLSDVS